MNHSRKEEPGSIVVSHTIADQTESISTVTTKMSSVGGMVVEMTQFGVENGKMVLGCSMARRKSRVSIELGVQNCEPRPRGASGANDSAYGDSGPSGVVSAVGSLLPRGTKANVAAYGSGGEASCQRPGYQPRY
ncbi:hypothetical protein PIB30_081332 [Stylosanthes scabra]|uniref:Uncharacterized protein n=1 Tax=Stylosanthes scabra TaxID=79078 RepID=A0ABU6VS05_9FABA|nr:hypothetical protein [Stylosanthes scabra]